LVGEGSLEVSVAVRVVTPPELRVKLPGETERAVVARLVVWKIDFIKGGEICGVAAMDGAKETINTNVDKNTAKISMVLGIFLF
jgi:hypothetical protein